MLGTVWPLPDVGSVDKASVLLFTSSQPISSSVLTTLSEEKERVGVARMRRGTSAWKEAVAEAGKEKPTRGMTRASDKLEEMIDLCLPDMAPSSFSSTKGGGSCLLLCEAPGGFVDTLLRKGVPPSSLHIASKRKGIQFASSIKKSGVRLLPLPREGDILYREARDFLSSTGNYHLITADGADDVDEAPALAEKRHAPLLLSEIDSALRSQAMGGTFLVKLLGMTEQVTMDALFLLSSAYEEVSVVKPRSSRSVNDERYVVCKGFRGPSSSLLVSSFLSSVSNTDSVSKEVVRLVEGERDPKWDEEAICIAESFALSQTREIRSALSCMERETKTRRVA